MKRLLKILALISFSVVAIAPGLALAQAATSASSAPVYAAPAKSSKAPTPAKLEEMYFDAWFAIGEKTFGKGVGFDEIDVPLGGELTVTTLKYATPSGFDVSSGGIDPQVVVVQNRAAGGDQQLAVGLKELEARIAASR